MKQHTVRREDKALEAYTFGHQLANDYLMVTPDAEVSLRGFVAWSKGDHRLSMAAAYLAWTTVQARVARSVTLFPDWSNWTMV